MRPVRRSEERSDYRNRFWTRGFLTTTGRITGPKVPTARSLEFRTSLFGGCQRRQRAPDRALRACFVGSVSTRKVRAVTRAFRMQGPHRARRRRGHYRSSRGALPICDETSCVRSTRSGRLPPGSRASPGGTRSFPRPTPSMRPRALLMPENDRMCSRRSGIRTSPVLRTHSGGIWGKP